MGFIRSGIVTVLAVVLLMSLFLMNASLTLTWSLEYDTLKPVIKEAVGGLVEEEFGLGDYLDDTISLMQIYCLNETEFIFNEGGYTFVIPCETINQGKDAVLDEGSDILIDSVYYAEYDCDYWECVKETDDFLVLISEKAHDYWRSKFFIFLLTSLALFVLIFIVTNKKSNAFILGGILAIVSSIPFIKLSWLSIFVPEEFKSIFMSFFARSHNVFLIMLIIGFFLLGLGITFHFLKWGLRISKLFRKDSGEDEDSDEDVSKEDVKKIVKKEMAKDKIKQTVKKEIATQKPKSKQIKQTASKKPANPVKPPKPIMKKTKK